VRYGTMKDNVLASKWCWRMERDRYRTPREEDSAGYDLTRLMVGSKARSAS
jgi:FAD/FMN-containing dehydrogenase